MQYSIPIAKTRVSKESSELLVLFCNCAKYFFSKHGVDLFQVAILFEETFFNKNDESYRVLCISQPLEGSSGQFHLGPFTYHITQEISTYDPLLPQITMRNSSWDALTTIM